MSSNDWQRLLSGSLEIEFSGQQFLLLPDKALFWPKQNALLVADVHLGKTNTFRQSGVAVPAGTGSENLRRLSQLLTTTRAQNLIVLGDWFHSERGTGHEIFDRIAMWRNEWRQVNCVVVQGNHDRKTLTLTNQLGLAIANDPLVFDGITLEHGHDANGGHANISQWDVTRPSIIGHYHPVCVLRGKARDSLRLPVFWKTKTRLCLPSFGEFTGGFIVEPNNGDEMFAVGDGQVFRLPTS
jgi:uncharacterized protein